MAKGAAEPVALAQALVDIAARRGWGRGAMAEASTQVFGARDRWRDIFPRGPVQVIWFISEVSDASMRAAFADRPAPDMTAVIATRFSQNRRLKAFVRRVMGFDLAHPVQALARMQRTARVMFDCLAPDRRGSSPLGRAALNLVYTGLVFIWLLDRSPDDRHTLTATRAAMTALGL